MFLKQLALVVHPDRQLLQRIHQVLAEAGLRVMAVGTVEEARRRLDPAFFPDLLVTPLAPYGLLQLPPLLSELRRNPLTPDLPAVVLATQDAEERRACLRLGIPHVVQPPYDAEELLLNVRLALQQSRDDSQLSGSLAQLSVPDLLQTMETTQRSGLLTLRSHGRIATLWMQDGQIIDAEIDDGRSGRTAVFAVVFWNQGSFEADFRDVSVPRRIAESTSHLLLEAMRRQDEANRRAESPPHAALPDPPPPPPRPLRAVHRAVTLLNVASSYALDHMAPKLLQERLERHRHQLASQHDLLDRFGVADGGQIYWAAEPDPNIDIHRLAYAVGGWIRAFFTDAERVLPGRFALRKLAQLTEAVQEDMHDLGFYEALGLVAEGTETSR